MSELTSQRGGRRRAAVLVEGDSSSDARPAPGLPADDETWSRFVGLYGELFYAWCRGKGVPRDDVVDVIQNAFRAVARDIGSFEYRGEGGAFSTRLSTTAGCRSGARLTVPGRLGPYDLTDLLGAGGMGRVYKASHRPLGGKVVALKVIRPEHTHSAQTVARFRQEVGAIGALADHPNVVRALDAGEVGGVHFLAMEYVDGTNLDRLVREHGPLPVGRACDYVRQAALGLAHIHEAGLTHRDVKPSNLLLNGSGVVKVSDLGLVRLGIDADTRGGLTGEGARLGTWDYMPPEQRRDARAADARSDVYGLGCTLAYLLGAQPPFDRLVGGLPDDVPERVRSIVGGMTAADPGARYPTATEAARYLAEAMAAIRPPVVIAVETTRGGTILFDPGVTPRAFHGRGLDPASTPGSRPATGRRCRCGPRPSARTPHGAD